LATSPCLSLLAFADWFFGDFGLRSGVFFPIERLIPIDICRLELVRRGNCPLFKRQQIVAIGIQLETRKNR
jgi:hypothetical protein